MAEDIRKGNVIDVDGKLYQIIEIQHIKMKRTALNRIKMRDIRSGTTIEQSFQNTEKFNKVRLDSRPMQFLYEDNGLYYVMDQESFEQIPLTKEQMSEAINYLVENMILDVELYQNEVLSVTPPITMVLTVVETDPGFAGDTKSGATKPAKLQTGYTLNVPLFVNQGEKIKVDTRTGNYLERV